MRFSYTIEIIPSVKTGFEPQITTEGTLEVWQGQDLFLRAEGILLVEFAIELEMWRRKLDKNESADLYYVSMDFPEEPIFAMTYDSPSGTFMPGAIWASREGAPVSPEVAVQATAEYLQSLDRELTAEGIDLQAVTEKVIDYIRQNTIVRRPR